MNLKVMSFNLRVPNDKKDGINTFENRKGNVLDAILREAPDLIGFQEAPDTTRAFLHEVLPRNYTLLGCGRKQNYRGETAPIAFRNDLFELISFDTFWLSSTPQVPGSLYEGSDQITCPRIAFHAVLHAEGTNEPLHFYNTHLDHRGKGARLLGMRDIIAHIKKDGGNFILTGDMNAQPESDCIKEILALPNVVEATENIPATFHFYGQYTTNSKIDYIFTTFKPLRAYAVEDKHENGIYISDHFPIVSLIEI